MMNTTLQEVVFGESPENRRRFVATGLLFLLASSIYAVVVIQPSVQFTTPVSGDVGALFLSLVLTLLAAWTAYRHSGLLTSWFVVFAPVFGWFAVLLAAMTVSPPDLGGFAWFGEALFATNLGWLVKAFVVALLFAMALGTLGYLLGIGGQRLRHRQRVAPNSSGN